VVRRHFPGAKLALNHNANEDITIVLNRW